MVPTALHLTPGGQYIHPLTCMETGKKGLQYVPSATAQIILSVPFVHQ